MAANVPYPTDELIETAMAMTEYSNRNVMIAALQAKNNDLEAVMNEWFDDAEKFKKTYSWDEAAFSADRDGNGWPGQPAPSFLIQGPDEGPVLQGVDPTEGYYPTPPSRPPSRANNISPMSRIVDLTTNTYAPSTKQQEDEQLQRALEASMQTSGIATPIPQAPQEAGILAADDDVNIKRFGPSTRLDYANEWAMVRLESGSVDPEPSRRKRDPDTPVFLRCREVQTWCQHRVGHIVSTLHNIPAARNLFLRLGTAPATGYGNDKDWWKGSPIVLPQYQAAQEAGVEVDLVTKRLQWEAELHRVTAFLDASERSYGTADMLAGGLDGAYDPEKEFLDQLIATPDGAAPEIRNPLQSVVEYLSVAGGTVAQSTSFSLFDLCPSAQVLRDAENLYNILDVIFFGDVFSEQPLETGHVTLLETAAEVIPIRIGGDDSLQRMIDIPETLYIDRYTSARMDSMKQVLIDMNRNIRSQFKGVRIEERLNKIVDPWTQAVSDREQAYLHNIECYKYKINLIKTRRQWLDHEKARAELKGDGEDEPDEFYYLPNHAPEPNLTDEEKEQIAYLESMVAKHESALAVRKRRLANLETQKEELSKIMQQLSTVLTEPSDDPKWNPSQKYTLRGVANSLEAVYIRRRETDLMELDEGTEPTEQWWKLSYEPNDDGPAIKSEKVYYERVMREACGAGTKPILIYATEKALTEELLPLEDAMKTFVKFDNRHFKMELNQESPRETKRSGFEDPTSPTKRNRVRSDSIDSFGTNRASAGSLDDDDSGVQMDLLSSGVPGDFADDAQSPGEVVQEMQEVKHSLGSSRGPSFAVGETSIMDLPMETGMAEIQARED
ncbi:hypothetical protein GQ53DRAFT_817799 [Thozetella sp. PMI_491]|nr:hypothetical protein GQ53DRAFT_817799 [Thozetella sp. PMI_491]